MTDKKIEELLEIRKELLKIINGAYDYITYHSSLRDSEEFIAAEKTIDESEPKLKEVELAIILKKPPIVSDDNLDLRAITDDVCNEYMIYLHDTDICVGKISYRGYHLDYSLADVGFVVYEEHQGNGYAAKALRLLEDYLLTKGIDSVWITVKDYNIPSRKTIEKCGGVLLSKEGDILKYECKTLNKDLADSVGDFRI